MKFLFHGTERVYFKLFVNAGSRFDTKVALGDYDVVFATGDRWLGLRMARRHMPFWPYPSRYKLNTPLSFSLSSDSYIGHDIELIDQKNGNLSKAPIGVAEFGDE